MGKGGVPAPPADVENQKLGVVDDDDDANESGASARIFQGVCDAGCPAEEPAAEPKFSGSEILTPRSALEVIASSMRGCSAEMTIRVKLSSSEGLAQEGVALSSGPGIVVMSSETSLYGGDGGGVQIAVENIGFAINALPGCFGPKKSKLKVDDQGLHHVLQNISGIHSSGRMLAILGPSGAGKTTLLNILGGNLTKTSGQIILNGEEACSPTDISEISAFVHQDDCMLSTMTVKETILFAAHMRLPYTMSNSKKAQRAANAIRLLGLDKCQSTIIGSSIDGTRGVSGGERKRCAIATELLTNPSIIFLDEPSSGLDAYAAYSLGGVLKTLCHLGKTVVMTIHQPSSDLYDMFDDMLLLASGQTVYWGEASKSVEYFCDLGYSCPPFSNPCDYFFLHVLNLSGPSGDSKLEQLHQSWRLSVTCKETQSTLLHKVSESSISIKDIVLLRLKSCVPVWRQIVLLTKRGFKHFLRNKMLLPSRLIQALISTLIALAVFWDVSENQTGIMARSGVLFYFVAGTLFTSVLSVLSAFSSERSVFIREYSNGAYSVFVYFCSKILVEYPFQILIPVLVSASSYFAIGLQQDGCKFAIFCLCLVMVNLCGTNIGLLLSSAFRDVAVALSLAPLFVLPFMLFSGFFISYEDTPDYVAWVQAISPVRYAFAALMQNEFNDLKLHCTPSQLIKGVPSGFDLGDVMPDAQGDGNCPREVTDFFANFSRDCGVDDPKAVDCLSWTARALSDPTCGARLATLGPFRDDQSTLVTKCSSVLVQPGNMDVLQLVNRCFNVDAEGGPDSAGGFYPESLGEESSFPVEICPIEDGSTYIELYGFDLLNIKHCLIMLGMLCVMTLALAYFMLFLTAARSRGKKLLCLSTYFSSHNF